MQTPEQFLKERLGEMRYKLNGHQTNALLQEILLDYAQAYHKGRLREYVPIEDIDAETVKRWHQKLTGLSEEEMKTDVRAIAWAAYMHQNLKWDDGQQTCPFKPGDKVIWDSRHGYDIGIFKGEGGAYYTWAVEINTGQFPGVGAFNRTDIYPYSKELVAQLTQKYGYEKDWSDETNDEPVANQTLN